MYKTALRSSPRPFLRAAARPTCRRLASSASPADKPRSWKSSALRWGLAGGAVYYYTTSPVFADSVAPQTIQAPSSFDDSDLPTVDSVLEQKRQQIQAKLDARRREEEATSQQEKQQKQQGNNPEHSSTAAAADGSPQALEDEAGQQGAFNPETGEINWDCPCLGGMAQGPCGEQFKAAFSCFVYSNEEPKGMDCIEKFQGMQECFREYPDIYGSELADEAEDEDVDGTTGESATVATPAPRGGDEAASQQVRVGHTEDAIPTKWEDATKANEEVDKEDDTKDKKDGEGAKKEADKKQ